MQVHNGDMADASNTVDVAGFADRLNTLQRSLLEAFLTGMLNQL